MKATSIIAILLIVLGLFGLVSGHISFRTKETVAHVGPIEARAERRHVISIPEAAGAIALVAGIVVLVTASNRT